MNSAGYRFTDFPIMGFPVLLAVLITCLIALAGLLPVGPVPNLTPG